MNINNIVEKLDHHKTNLVDILSGKNWGHFRSYFFIREKTIKKEFDDNFKSTFCSFYILNGPTGLNNLQKNRFFQLLVNKEDDMGKLLNDLYLIPGYGGSNRLHLSFCSKLIHTLDYTSPIYDKNVASILELSSPTQTGGVGEKITNRVLIYKELQEKSDGLLKDSRIKKYIISIRKDLQDKAKREHFNWQNTLISDEKLLDSLLWALYTTKN